MSQKMRFKETESFKYLNKERRAFLEKKKETEFNSNLSQSIEKNI